MNPRKESLNLMLVLVVMAMAFNPSSTAAGSNTTETRPSAVQTSDPSPRLVLETGGHRALIRELLFTADGRELVSVSDDKTMRVWSVSPDGRKADLARTIRGQIEDGRAGQLAAAALSPPDARGVSNGSPWQGF